MLFIVFIKTVNFFEKLYCDKRLWKPASALCCLCDIGKVTYSLCALDFPICRKIKYLEYGKPLQWFPG
jgi:hypothetical protein